VTSNQLKRQEDESKRLREDLDVALTQNKEMQSKLKDERRRYSDLESKLKEDSVHARIKDAEKSQVQNQNSIKVPFTVIIDYNWIEIIEITENVRSIPNNFYSEAKESRTNS